MVADRCQRCRRLRCYFGNNHRLGVCWQCTVEIHRRNFGRVIGAAISTNRELADDSTPLFHQVLRKKHLWQLIIQYSCISTTLWHRKAQHNIWMRVLRGKYVWTFFDCGYAISDSFSGFFGVSSVNLVGPNSPFPVHLQVLYGVRIKIRPYCSKSHDEYLRHELHLLDYLVPRNLLDLVIAFLGYYQTWMDPTTRHVTRKRPLPEWMDLYY